MDADRHLGDLVPELAHERARRYQRPEEPFDDLFQVACLGLVKAIDRFDLSRDVAFSSYAVPTILGEIKRYFRDRTWSVRVPRDLQELALRVDRKVARLAIDLHRQPTVTETANAMGLDEETVLEALEASAAYRATSLSLPRSNEDEAGETLGDTVGTSEEGFGLAEETRAIEGRHADPTLALDDVAREIATSSRQLQRVFAELAGSAFRDEVAAVRMQHGAALLQTTDLPVSEVAHRVGYRQAAQFAKAFRRHHGTSPSRLRRLAG